MYLSRARLEPGSGFAPRASHLYGAHQLVWRLFDDDPEAQRDFLFRVDLADAPGKRGEIYVLSQRRPRPVSPWPVQTKPFEPKLQKGDVLRFSLRASPSVKKDGRRHDVVMHRKVKLKEQGVPQREWPPSGEILHEEAGAWLKARAAGAGFAVDEDQLLVSEHASFAFRKRRQRTQGPPVQISSCDFLGRLEVEDPDVFVRALRQGFGPSKAFGMGLMLLKRA